jgi:hypothetical protein
MLGGVSGSIVRALAVFAVALVAAGCASTVGGEGSVSAGAASSASGSGSHDFPSGSPGPGSSSVAASSAAPATPATPSSSIHQAGPRPLSTRTVHASDGTVYQVNVYARARNKTCFDHAYGRPMIEFLTKHPCGGLTRILATTTVGGRPVGIAQAATSFAGTAKDPYKWSGAFVKLEQADNTGSIKDLMREGRRLPEGPKSIPASEAFNVLSQDNVVTVWDVWYLDGPTPANAKPLIKMTEDLFLLI